MHPCPALFTPRHDELKGWILNSEFTRDPIIPHRSKIRMYCQLIVDHHGGCPLRLWRGHSPRLVKIASVQHCSSKGCSPDMPQHDCEEYVLVVGATRNGLAEINVAMSWPLSAEVFSPVKQDDFSDLLHGMSYSMLYYMTTNRKMYLTQNVVLLLEVPT